MESDPAAAFSYLTSRWKRRSFLVNFTDVQDPIEARSLITGFGPMARRHVALLARISDPRLKQSLDSSIDSLDDFYTHASALFFTSERKEAESVLSAAGLHSLEAEPQDLAAALVSFYFEVKEKSMI